MVFYALHLFVSLRGLMAVLGGIFVFVGVMGFIENDIRGTSYKVKPNLIAGSICLILMLIIPSKETLLLMKASEFVTYDNAQLTVEALKTAIDYAATLF